MKKKLGVFNWGVIASVFSKSVFGMGVVAMLSFTIISLPAFWETLLAGEKKVACLESQALSQSGIQVFFASREHQDDCSRMGIEMAKKTPFTAEEAYDRLDAKRKFPQI